MNFLVGVDDDLSVTLTVIVMENLKENDKIYVEMRADEQSSDSMIFSSGDKKEIAFIGLKIG